jgi:hypothetical protein
VEYNPETLSYFWNYFAEVTGFVLTVTNLYSPFSRI